MVKKMTLMLLLIIAALLLGTALYLQQPKFGSLPDGARLEKLESSPHYSNGKFQNLVPTTVVVNERNLLSLWWDFLFAKKERLTPSEAIPVVKTDLKIFDISSDVVIWLGHSSYYMQLGGKRILIDPVFSAYASPVSFANKAFAGTNLYTAEDMPEIDCLIISHDHWDHLDYFSIIALKPKINHVVCGLGVGNYFAQWGFEEKRIHEADWYEQVPLEDNFLVHVLPARHYSGRMLSKDKTLWIGAAFVTRERQVFFSGDSGYGPHFKEIGERFRGFDLAILDAGQYDTNWPSIHMTPEEAAQAAEELQTHSLLLGHIGKFAIANHPWDEPFQRIVSASQNKPYQLITPLIGEIVELANSQQVFSRWWEQVE